MDLSTENNDILEEKIKYAAPFKRGLANFIDMIIVLFLRIFIAQILIAIWLKNVAEKLALDYKNHFDSEVIKSQENLDFISNHPAFNHFMAFFLIIFLVGAFYHCFLNSSSFKATFGKRFLNIMILDKNYQKISILRGFCHYVLSILPFLVIIYLISYQFAHQVNLVRAIVSNIFNLTLLIIASIWVNANIINKKKSTIYDAICQIVMIEGKSNAKKFWHKLKDDEI